MTPCPQREIQIDQAGDDTGSVAATDSHSTPKVEAPIADGLHAFIASRFPLSTMIGAQAIETTWATSNNTSGVIDRAILCTHGTAK
jgi:hypothetical protein